MRRISEEGRHLTVFEGHQCVKRMSLVQNLGVVKKIGVVNRTGVRRAQHRIGSAL